MRIAHLLNVFGFLLTLSVASIHTQQASCPVSWTVDYAVSGGVAGLNRSLHLQSDGKTDFRYQIKKTSFATGAESLSRICRMVADCKASPSAPGPKVNPMPDTIYFELKISLNGRECQLQTQEKALLNELESIMTDGSNRIAAEAWAKAGPFRLGRSWHVTEEVRDDQGYFRGEIWEGTWTPTPGAKNTFDALWRNNRTHQEVHDTVVLDSAELGNIVMHRVSSNVKYVGHCSPERPQFIYGTVEPGKFRVWTVEITY
jgi:hypothetical protein